MEHTTDEDFEKILNEVAKFSYEETGLSIESSEYKDEEKPVPEDLE
jgi:hypothetical protein